MDLIPVRIHGHDEQAGKVIVLVPKFTSKVIHALFPRTQALFFRIKLDETGSVIWKHISGEDTVGEICKEAVTDLANIGIPDEDMEERVSRFMTILYERRLITFRQITDA